MTSDPSVLPPVLYKALESQFLEGLLEKGRVRIGCLSDYRTIEARIDAIQDAGEGYRRIEIGELQVERARFGDLPYPIGTLGLLPQNAIASFDIRECIADDYAPDAYIFSATTSMEAGQQIYPYGAGVKITNPVEFGNLVAKALHALGFSTGEFVAGKCVYVPETQDFRSLARPPLVFQKELRFAGQDEFRFAWAPTSAPTPRIIEVEELTSLLERAW